MPVQMNFAEKFLSHKFKGNGVKYEVGVCIKTGDYYQERFSGQ